MNGISKVLFGLVIIATSISFAVIMIPAWLFFFIGMEYQRSRIEYRIEIQQNTELELTEPVIKEYDVKI